MKLEIRVQRFSKHILRDFAYIADVEAHYTHRCVAGKLITLQKHIIIIIIIIFFFFFFFFFTELTVEILHSGKFHLNIHHIIKRRRRYRH